MASIKTNPDKVLAVGRNGYHRTYSVRFSIYGDWVDITATGKCGFELNAGMYGIPLEEMDELVRKYQRERNLRKLKGD